jgi:hypothetical protein
VFFREASIIVELEYWHFRDQSMKSQTNGSKLFGFYFYDLFMVNIAIRLDETRRQSLIITNQKYNVTLTT